MQSLRLSGGLIALAAGACFTLGGCPQTATPDNAGTANSVVSGGGGLPTFVPGTATNGSGTGTSSGSGPTTLTPQTITIEPDDFDSGTDLTMLNAHVQLYTTTSDNDVVELFYVTATTDDQGLAPTGDKVFGHFNIPFFYDERRLLMDFETPASAISVTFAGGNPNGTETGRLRAFNSAGAMLAEYVTVPRGGGEVEVMSITRDVAEITTAIAYIASGEGSFGRMDALTFTIQVPQTGGATVSAP